MIQQPQLVGTPPSRTTTPLSNQTTPSHNLATPSHNIDNTPTIGNINALSSAAPLSGFATPTHTAISQSSTSHISLQSMAANSNVPVANMALINSQVATATTSYFDQAILQQHKSMLQQPTNSPHIILSNGQQLTLQQTPSQEQISLQNGPTMIITTPQHPQHKPHHVVQTQSQSM